MIHPVEWVMAAEAKLHPQEVHNFLCTWEQVAYQVLDGSVIDYDEWYKNAVAK